MDPKLAAIYGTNEDADLEKLAAAELAEGLADDEQLDTDGLSEDDLEAIAQDVLNGGEESEEEGSGNIDGDEAQEKLAEADYLGRVMAHSYVNELKGIEKQAKRTHTPEEAIAEREAGRAKHDKMGKEGPSLMAKAENKVRGAATKVKEYHKGAVSDLSEAVKGEARMVGKHGTTRTMQLGKGGRAFRAARGAAKFAPHAAGLAAVGYGAKKMMDKKSSALDTLVEQRAQEILAASGIDANELELMNGQEKVSDPREALASAVDERAWALLGQFGVVPNEE
jgi:hypothetical protein